MNRLCVVAACAVLSSGCISHRACSVTFAPDHAELGISEDFYGIVPGICGLTGHASYAYAFRLEGLKAEYHDSEIQEIPLGAGALPPPRLDLYKGTVSIVTGTKRVSVKLSERGGDGKDYPFELNGRYRYR